MFEQCLSGHPNLCQTGLQTKREGGAPRLTQDGRLVGQFLSVAGFAERMLPHENSLSCASIPASRLTVRRWWAAAC